MNKESNPDGNGPTSNLEEREQNRWVIQYGDSKIRLISDFGTLEMHECEEPVREGEGTFFIPSIIDDRSRVPELDISDILDKEKLDPKS